MDGDVGFVWRDLHGLQAPHLARRNITQQKCNAIRAAIRYFLGWVGMDHDRFFPSTKRKNIIARASLGSFNYNHMCRGPAHLDRRANRISDSPLLAVGSEWSHGHVLHFGTFKLLALFWKAQGYPVEPIMRLPTRATSITDFWHRWNADFATLPTDSSSSRCIDAWEQSAQPIRPLPSPV